MKKMTIKLFSITLLLTSISVPQAVSAEETDTTAPVLEDFQMSIEPGSTVRDDDEIFFTIEASDDVELDESNSRIYLERVDGDGNLTGYLTGYYVLLGYEGNGIYEGSISVSHLDAYEWYVYSIEIYDKAGNCAYISEFDPVFYYNPYYFYVERDGVCNKRTFEQLKLSFYEQPNTNKQNNNLLYEFTVEDVPSRTTLSDLLGDQYPVMEEHEVFGKFIGWGWEPYYWNWDVYTEDTPLVLVSRNYANLKELELFPVYEKQYLYVELVYMDEKGVWHSEYPEILGEAGASMETILKELPEPVNSKYKFTGWEIVIGSSTISRYPRSYWIVEATYDYYPIKITHSYIDKEGNVKTVSEVKDFPAGTRYEDIVAEELEIPVDGSDEYKMTGWHMFDPGKEIDEEGTIGARIDERGRWSNYFNFVAEYEEKSLEYINYKYVNEENKFIEDKRFIICDKKEADSEEAVSEEAMKYIPTDHSQEMGYQGTWEVNVPSYYWENVYELSADYRNVLVDFVLDNSANILKSVVTEPGQTIETPEGYGIEVWNSDTQTYEGYKTEYIVPEDSKLCQLCWCSELPEKMKAIQKIERATDGAAVEMNLEESTVLTQDVLETLKGKNVTLDVSMADGTVWSINGTELPTNNLQDIDLSVIRANKESGNISMDQITVLAGERMAEQLTFAEDEGFPAASKLSLTIDSAVSGNKAVFLQSENKALALMDSSLITNNTITFDITSLKDSIIVYGINGDVNDDEKVDIKDLMRSMYHVSGRESLNEVQKGFADVNMNDSVNIQDLMSELHYISGRTDSLADAK